MFERTRALTIIVGLAIGCSSALADDTADNNDPGLPRPDPILRGGVGPEVSRPTSYVGDFPPYYGENVVLPFQRQNQLYYGPHYGNSGRTIPAGGLLVETARSETNQRMLSARILGRWRVERSRTIIEALPQFQPGIDALFPPSDNHSWTIQGNPAAGYNIITDDTGTQAAVIARIVDTL